MRTPGFRYFHNTIRITEYTLIQGGPLIKEYGLLVNMIVGALNDNCLAVMAEACQYFYQLRKKIQTQGGIELVWSIHLQALLLESIFAGKIQLDKTILLQLTVGVPER